MATGIFKVLWHKGLGIMARDTPHTRNGRAQGAADPTPVATGTITALRDGGFGFITRDTPSDRNDLFFHRAEVAGDGFDHLWAGQRVRFGEEPDPHDRNRQRAVDVRPAGGGDRDEVAAGATPGH